MNALKPCPFCGGRATIYNANGEVSIACVNCQCGTAYITGASPVEVKIETATNDWNNRVESEELKFTREFIHEHGLEFELASAWSRRVEDGRRKTVD